VDAEFVGHPLADLPRPAISRDQYATEHGLDISKPWITLMPGSRVKEVRMNLFTMVDAVLLLGSDYEYLLPVAPTLDPELLYREIGEDQVGDARVELPNIKLVSESLPALAHSRAGIIASGTATVEAAMMETPFVMVYRVTPLTYLLGRSTVKVPHFAMVNLIAGEEVVPELVQGDFTPERVGAEVTKIISNGDPRDKMLRGLRRVRTLLRGDGEDAHPADRAAQAVTGVLRR
jgi:lipid-A-disaccharide synthase